MIPMNIKKLLLDKTVERERIEFKKNWDTETSLKTVCAFANDVENLGGGYIVIETIEEEINNLQKKILEACELIYPEYQPIIEVDEYGGKTYILIWCIGGSYRPYALYEMKTKGNWDKRYYIRKGSTTVIPNEEELSDLFNLVNNIPFDDRVNYDAELYDLNLTLIRSYLRETGSALYEQSGKMDFQTLCTNMNLISVLPEYVKPKNVALMFFNLEPEKYFPYAQIDVVSFPDGEGGNEIVEAIFKGPLQDQLRSALRYIQNSYITEKVIKYPDRAEADRFFNYPYEAVEEALANAVYHKGYDEREPIEVRILADRMEIISHPGPDRSVTPEGLAQYRVFNRRYRNRRIGEFLKELHLTEGRNTGFMKILRATEKNGSPMPLFETDEYRSYFATTLFVHEAFKEPERH